MRVVPAEGTAVVPCLSCRVFRHQHNGYKEDGASIKRLALKQACGGVAGLLCSVDDLSASRVPLPLTATYSEGTRLVMEGNGSDRKVEEIYGTPDSRTCNQSNPKRAVSLRLCLVS